MNSLKNSFNNSQITGRIYSEKGAFLSGAKVICNGTYTFTLFDGTFSIKNLKPGTYNLKVSLKGFKNEEKKIILDKDEQRTVNFQLTEASGCSQISGIVYDVITKKPISSGGTVILILPIMNKYAHLDKNGLYRFENLSPDTYELWTSIPRYEDAKSRITIKEDETISHDFFCKPITLEDPPWG